MIPETEHVIESLAPQLPIFDVQTMSQALNTLNGLLFYKIGAVLAALLGMLGLILAIVGVYGVVSYAATQKTHEIGVRMALGAQPADILKMVFREGLLIVGIGLVVGIARRAGCRASGWQLSDGERSRSGHVRDCDRDTHDRGAERVFHSSAARDACGSDGRAAIRVSAVTSDK